MVGAIAWGVDVDDVVEWFGNGNIILRNGGNGSSSLINKFCIDMTWFVEDEDEEGDSFSGGEDDSIEGNRSMPRRRFLIHGNHKFCRSFFNI